MTNGLLEKLISCKVAKFTKTLKRVLLLNEKSQQQFHLRRHAKRASVQSDDVKLLARKNPKLQDHLKNFPSKK